MAAVVEPSSPAQMWWEPAGLHVVTEDAASTAITQMVQLVDFRPVDTSTSDSKANLERAAWSTEATELLAQLSDEGSNWASLHLAALTGHPAVAAAVVALFELSGSCGQLPWQDPNGRTPLHCAALFDSGELVQVLLGVCDPSPKDRWGRTALDVAIDLDHHAAAAVLQGRPWSLTELGGQKLRALLRRGPKTETSALRSSQLKELVPLHDYRAWSNVQDVDPSTVLRSMSCLECWYADAFGKKCSAALPSHLELIRVWDDLASFQAPACAAATLDVALLAEAQGPRKAPTVADRTTFIERFRRRTGGILEGLDWSRVLVIGGMVLACLIADDEEYARDFQETDVDIYVVGAGLSGDGLAAEADVDDEDDDEDDDYDVDPKPRTEFRQCVSRIMSCLPDASVGQEYPLRLSSESLGKHGGDPGVVFEPDHENNRLVVTAKTAALAECQHVRPGDFILEVDDEDTVEGMTEALASRKRFGNGTFVPKHLFVRPARSEQKAASACVARTPQTLTACVRQSSGEPLPNVQVVLAPYASPAHLLFTTDLDCTAMGFDGTELYATPRAREAIRHRRNIARPEKYMVRGEWRTEARLLKYAMRGFRVVDLGLLPHALPVANESVANAAQKAQALLEAAEPDWKAVERCIQRVHATGVHGAQLLLLAGHDEGLRRLLLYEQPLLPAGLDWHELLELVTNSECSRPYRRRGNQAAEAAGAGSGSRERLVEFHDGYGMARAKLVMVNPFKPGRLRVLDDSLRCHEISLKQAIVELDLEADRFEVRGWYDGIQPGGLRDEHAALDPAVWKGVGDFRRSD